MHAFIGLGNMGALIAECLLNAGHQLRVFDLSESARAALGARGADVAASVREAADGTDVAILCLPNAAIVEAVLTGPDGILGAERMPRVVVDCTSSEPLVTQRLAAVLAERGVALIDAPVSGGLMAARRAALTSMVGGNPQDIEGVRSILDAFAAVWGIAGPVGAGHASKAINNYLSSASYLLTSEAVIAGRALGIGAVPLVETFAKGETRSQNSEVKFPAFVVPRRFEAGFSIGLEAKDVDIAFGIGARSSRPTPLASASRATWLAGERELGAAADFTEIYALIERWSGIGPDTPSAVTSADHELVETLAFGLASSLRVATLEALALVEALDLEPAAVFALISKSTGRNYFTTYLEHGRSGTPADQLPTPVHPHLEAAEARSAVRDVARRSKTPMTLTTVAFGL